MGTRTRGFALAGARLLTAAAPFILMQEPAGAAVNDDNKSAQLTFAAYGGGAVTCTVYNSSNHDTTNKTATASGSSYGPSQCYDAGSTYYTVTVSAKDENGVTHSTTASAYTGFSL